MPHQPPRASGLTPPSPPRRPAPRVLASSRPHPSAQARNSCGCRGMRCSQWLQVSFTFHFRPPNPFAQRACSLPPPKTLYLPASNLPPPSSTSHSPSSTLQTPFHHMLPGEASPWPQELPQPVWLQLPEWCQLALKLVDAVGPQGAERYPQLQVWMPYYWGVWYRQIFPAAGGLVLKASRWAKHLVMVLICHPRPG